MLNKPGLLHEIKFLSKSENQRGNISDKDSKSCHLPGKPTRPRGYKKKFVLNSAKQEILTAHTY